MKVSTLEDKQFKFMINGQTLLMITKTHSEYLRQMLLLHHSCQKYDFLYFKCRKVL